MQSKKIIPKKKTVLKKAVIKKKTMPPPVPDHIIERSKGVEMVNRFDDNRTNFDNIVFSRGMEFDKSLFEKLLKLKGINKIRIYNAVNDNNEHTFVITGADSKMNDIYFKIKRARKSTGSKSKMALAADSSGVGNMGNSCPVYPDETIVL